MDLDSIEVFLAIARTRSISKAAKNLFISQSTVSYRLKLLEEELNCQLVERGRGQNQSTLTKEGENFLPIAERMKRIRYDIDSFKEVSRHPTITIGCVESMGVYLLDEFYNNIVKRNNKIKMYFMLNDNRRIYEMVERGQIDVAYVIESMRYKNIQITQMFSERMVLAASKNFEFTGRSIHPKQLDIRDACQFDWKEQGLTAWYEHWFSPKELPYMKTNSPPLAYNFMKSHDCWAVLPYSMGVRLERDADINLFELEEPPLERVCYRIVSKSMRHRYPEAIQYWDREINRFLQTKNFLSVAGEGKN